MKECKVLLLGDSISMGYREYVRDQLQETCHVLYPAENCKFTAYTYRMLYEWRRDLCIEDGVDLIYWNNGLWDVVRVFGDGPQTDLTAYENDIKRLLHRLKYLFPTAKICWATTTPVMEALYSEDFFRRNSDIEKYNATAKAVLERHVTRIDDLYRLVKDAPGDPFYDATHFTDEFNQVLGSHVVQTIRNALADKLFYSKQFLKEERKKSDAVVERLASAAEKPPIVAWGAGNIFSRSIDIISQFCTVLAVADINPQLHGKTVCQVPCISPDMISDYSTTVIITVENRDQNRSIAEQCRKNHFDFCSFDILLPRFIRLLQEQALAEMGENVRVIDQNPHTIEVMRKYIGFDIPISHQCNLRCSYCYLNGTFDGSVLQPKAAYIPKFVRMKLSRQRIGGSALIGLCGDGETLLSEGFTQLCVELLKEGHYLHIVTNGVLVKKIQEILEEAGDYAGHIIFKLSFHYLQLKQKKLLSRFVEAVKMIDSSEASYTIELMPHDELEEYIDEVKAFSLHNFGALPQLTIGRDENNARRVLSRKSFREYYDTWRVFQSNMLDARMKMYLMKGKQCRAGDLSYWIDLTFGALRRCLFHENLGNIYLPDDKTQFDCVGDDCPLDYCFNCHVYATLGVVDADSPSYYEIRDRMMVGGGHWIKENMRRFLDIKLDEIYPYANS